MEINAKIIERQEELLSIIKGGTNPLDYIKNESDVDLICSAIAHESKSQDPYFDETAETLTLKAAAHANPSIYKEIKIYVLSEAPYIESVVLSTTTPEEAAITSNWDV